MIYVYAFNISEIKNIEEAKKFLKYISDERKNKINKLIFEKDVIQSIFAEIVLRFALWQQYDFDDVKIRKGEYGKPYLEDYNHIHFNLSHSGEWVVCAVGDKKVGIDVEQIKENNLEVSKLVFTSAERDYLSTLDISNGTKEFYKIWTLKESYIKNVGKGLAIPLKTFEFIIEDNKIMISIQGKKSYDYLFISCKIDDNYYMAVCIECKLKKHVDMNMHILSFAELKRWKKLQ